MPKYGWKANSDYMWETEYNIQQDVFTSWQVGVDVLQGLWDKTMRLQQKPPKM